MFWSATEDLHCVQNDGKSFVYNMSGREKKTQHFSMGQEAQEMKIVDCHNFESPSGTGLAVLTTNHRIFVVNNVEDPKLWRTSELASKSVGFLVREDSTITHYGFIPTNSGIVWKAHSSAVMVANDLGER